MVVRSRESESDVVNARMLKPDAVQRRHIAKWAIGKDQIQPGVIGADELGAGAITEVHLGTQVVQALAVGQTVTLTASAQDIADGGGPVEWDTILSVPDRVGFSSLAVPTSTVAAPDTAYWMVEVELDWTSYTGDASVELHRDGAKLWPTDALPDVWTGSGRFEASRILLFNEAAGLTVEVVQSSGEAQELAGATLTFSLVERPLSVVLPEPWHVFTDDEAYEPYQHVEITDHPSWVGTSEDHGIELGFELVAPEFAWATRQLEWTNNHSEPLRWRMYTYTISTGTTSVLSGSSWVSPGGTWSGYDDSNSFIYRISVYPMSVHGTGTGSQYWGDPLPV